MSRDYYHLCWNDCSDFSRLDNLYFFPQGVTKKFKGRQDKDSSQMVRKEIGLFGLCYAMEGV